jgi:mono/diheme cytochrome c family protein
MTLPAPRLLRIAAVLALLPSAQRAFADTQPAHVHALLRSHCLECHSTAKQKGDLDLEASSIQREPHVWENVLEQIATGEMPPKKERQFSPTEKETSRDGSAPHSINSL